jgi:hypothetical protein
MRPDLRSAVFIVFLLFAARGSFAATDPKTVTAPPAAPDPISEALCGRKSSESARAGALDAFDFAAVPESWRNRRQEELKPWLEVVVCDNVTPDEHSLFMRRRKVFQDLRAHLDRALQIDHFEKAVLSFPAWRPVHDDWPAPGDCRRCDELRLAATLATKHVASWPKRKKADIIGSWLDGEEKRESLIALLCKAKPSPAALADMEKNFRYYTWTPPGANLLQIAAWFNGQDVVEECLHQ